MVRTLMLFIILLLSGPSYADWQEARLMLFSGGDLTVNPCDTCSGSLIFSWHMEAENIESGTPCGCSNDADKTIELVGGMDISNTQESDGTYSLHRGSTLDAAYITITGASKSEGYVSFDLWIVAYPSSGTTYVYYLGDGVNDVFSVVLSSSSTIIVNMTYGGTSRTATLADPGTGAWKTGCYFYYRTSGSPYVYGNCGGQTAENTNSTSAMTDTPTILMIGGEDTTVGYFYIDNMKIYNVYNP